MRNRLRLRSDALVGVLFTILVACATATSSRPSSASAAETQANHIRSLERKRIRALVDGDTLVASPLHAADFQLVTPSGSTLSKERYMNGIASGRLHYAEWQPESIAVRLFGSAAVIRYKSKLVMIVAGQDTIKPFAHWHTDLWELRGGSWLAVWSQATAIR